MTVEQVADYLQLNRLTVYRYVREGKIPAARIGKLYRISRRDVDQFLEARRVGEPDRRRRPVRHAGARVRPVVVRPAHPEDIYTGPTWRQEIKERKDRELAVFIGYPLDWVMPGLR